MRDCQKPSSPRRIIMRLLATLVFIAPLVTVVTSHASGEQDSPSAPNFVAANVDGARVTLVFASSSPPTLPRTFVVEAGTDQGLSNLAVFEGPLNLTTIVVSNVPVGTYYVRARERNAEGISSPSNERVVTVLGCPSTPEPPFGFGAGIVGQSVMFAWADDTSGCAPSAYDARGGFGPRPRGSGRAADLA